jgi:hypothetical protein
MSLAKKCVDRVADWADASNTTPMKQDVKHKIIIHYITIVIACIRNYVDTPIWLTCKSDIFYG